MATVGATTKAERASSAQWIRRGGWLAAGLVAVCLWQDGAFLASSPYPFGIDGYYYAAVAEGGAGASTGRVTAWLPTQILRGLGQVLPAPAAAKVFGVAALYGTGAVAFLLVLRISRSPALSLLALFLVVKGFMRAELLVNFPRQSLGHLEVMLLALYLAGETGRWVFRGGAVVLLLACAAATHPVAFVMGVLLVISDLALRAFERAADPGRGGLWRRPYTGFLVLAWAVPWAMTFGLNALSGYAGPWRHMLHLSTTRVPRFNVPLLYDGLSPITPVAPLVLIETLALCAALVVFAVFGARVERHPRHLPGLRRRLRAGLRFMPATALTFSPFLLGAEVYSVGLHFRLVCALGMAAAVLVPLAVSLALRPRRRRRVGVLIAAAALAVLPPAWPPSVRPLDDGGALDRAMRAVASEIPEDAVIITSLRIGNMVTALWDRPRVIATRYEPDLSRARYYRLTVFHPEVRTRLEAHARSRPDSEAPRALTGPWMLVPEGLYRDFREELRAADPALAKNLIE